MKRALRHLGRNIFSKHDIKREQAPAGPSFEAFEPRILLSGDVMASVVHGNLNIRGDIAANAIVLDQTGLAADQVRISGAGGTTINSLAGPVVLSGITRNVDIRMGAGDDSVTMNDLSLPGNVLVNGEGGANTLTLDDVQVATSLNIKQNSSSLNTTTITDTTVGKDLMMVWPGSGVENIALQSVEVQRNTKIVSGNGADTLTVDDSTFHGTVQLYTGQGTDSVQIETNGATLGPPTQFDGPVTIVLGSGDDTLQVGVANQTGNRAVFSDRVLFDGGAGHDTLINSVGNTYTKMSQFRIVRFESNPTAPNVSSSVPVNAATGVLTDTKIAVTFSSAMDPLTLTTRTFTLKQGRTSIAGTVAYSGTTATFSPTKPLASDATFTATVTTGARDLAGNPLASSFTWTFKTGTQVSQASINLGAASTFAVMATAATSGSADHINGDVGLHPGSSQGIDPSQVTGGVTHIHVNDQAIIDAQAALLAAYNDAISRSVNSISLPGNLGGLTLTPGLYTNSTSVLISGSGPGNNVTLDAQGDPNAVFIFKMGSTLTTGPGAQVILAGGAKASNIFWQVGSSATLNTTTIFYGNILAAVSISVNTGSVVVGRLLAGANGTPSGAVTIQGSTVTVPVA